MVRVELNEVLNTVEGYINTFEEESLKELGRRLAYIHPTLQQNIMRVVIAFIEAEAEKLERGNYDARNKATVELCKELWEIVKDRHLPFI